MRCGDGGQPSLLTVSVYYPDPFAARVTAADRMMAFDTDDAEEAVRQFAEYTKLPVTAVLVGERVAESTQFEGIALPAGAFLLTVHPDAWREEIEPFAVVAIAVSEEIPQP
jgi:hypothetical protein